MSMTSGTQAALAAMRQSVQALEEERKANNTKFDEMDKTMAQIAKEVTTLSNAQRQSNSDYLHIKEQIVLIARDNGEMKKEMMEMKDMIMSIGHHLGGMRRTSEILSSQEALNSQPSSNNQSPNLNKQDEDSKTSTQQEYTQETTTTMGEDAALDDA